MCHLVSHKFPTRVVENYPKFVPVFSNLGASGTPGPKCFSIMTCLKIMEVPQELLFLWVVAVKLLCASI